MTTDSLASADISAVEARMLASITETAWLDLACALIPAGQPEAENPLDPDEEPGREEARRSFIADTSGRWLRHRTADPSVRAVQLGRIAAGGWRRRLADPERPSRHLSGPATGRLDHDGAAIRSARPATATGSMPAAASDTRGNLACTLLATRAVLAPAA